MCYFILVLGDDWRHIDSVATADERLRDFDDFLVTVDAQGERCEGVKRMTLLEKNFSNQLQREVIKVLGSLFSDLRLSVFGWIKKRTQEDVILLKLLRRAICWLIADKNVNEERLRYYFE